MPDITDEELKAAQRAFALIQQLSSNAEARPHFERSLKVIDPRVQTQEDIAANIAKPYVAEIEGLKKRLDDRDAAEARAAEQRQEDDAMATLNEGFGRLQREEGLTAEGEETLKKLMVEHKIASPEAAFAFMEKRNPRPKLEQSAYVPDSWNYENDAPDTKAWFTNPDKAEQDTIGQVLLEMRRSGE